MEKEQAVSQAKEQFAAASEEALNAALASVWDAKPESVVSPDDQTPFSQADIDQAVATVTASDAAAMSALQEQLQLNDAKMKAVKETVAKQLQDAIAALQEQAVSRKDG